MVSINTGQLQYACCIILYAHILMVYSYCKRNIFQYLFMMCQHDTFQYIAVIFSLAAYCTFCEKAGAEIHTAIFNSSLPSYAVFHKTLLKLRTMVTDLSTIINHKAKVR